MLSFLFFKDQRLAAASIAAEARHQAEQQYQAAVRDNMAKRLLVAKDEIQFYRICLFCMFLMAFISAIVNVYLFWKIMKIANSVEREPAVVSHTGECIVARNNSKKQSGDEAEEAKIFDADDHVEEDQAESKLASAPDTLTDISKISLRQLVGQLTEAVRERGAVDKKTSGATPNDSSMTTPSTSQDSAVHVDHDRTSLWVEEATDTDSKSNGNEKLTSSSIVHIQGYTNDPFISALRMISALCKSMEARKPDHNRFDLFRRTLMLLYFDMEDADEVKTSDGTRRYTGDQAAELKSLRSAIGHIAFSDDRQVFKLEEILPEKTSSPACEDMQSTATVNYTQGHEEQAQGQQLQKNAANSTQTHITI